MHIRKGKKGFAYFCGFEFLFVRTFANGGDDDDNDEEEK